jgi:putative salt-induced outer membrane protein YdiY
MPRIRTIGFLLALSVCSLLARADEVRFKNGDRVSGAVTRAAGRVTITSKLFGVISADESEIAEVMATTMATGAPATASSLTATTLATTSPIASPIATPPPQPAAPKRWSGSVLAGAIVTRGNSHTENYRVAVDATRKGTNNTLTLAAAYAFGQTRDPNTGDDSVTTDNWFVQAKLDHSLTERLYDYAILRIEQDNVANLDLRASPGVGIGYRWINSPQTHFNTEAGVTWVWEQYDTSGSTEHIALRLAYHLDHKLNDHVSLVHNVEYLPNVADPTGDFNVNADAGLRATLTKSMFAEMKVEWKHDSTPAPDAEKNDLRYTLGVGWSF